MSKLVQKWDASYTFNEYELTMFAETQKSLAVPFRAPPAGDGKRTSAAVDENDLWAAELVAEHELCAGDVPPEVLSLQRKLQARHEVAQRQCHLMNKLEERVSQLQESHEQVRSKSLVMDSLWDGLVSKQVQHGNTRVRVPEHSA